MSDEHNNAPAVPQGWKSVLIPTEWTIGPNLFKDWCSQWFGPDADDDHLMRAAHALLGLTATPAPAPAQERCHLCDCTGDIHDATGEWRGECPYCKPAQDGLSIDRIFSLADAHAEESAENGNRAFDRGGLIQFVRDVEKASAKPAQEVTQSEPIYQLQRGDGSWIDQDKASYDYNAQYGINTIRIVYTAPEPEQEVGLTDEEIKQACADIYLSDHPQGSESYDIALGRAVISALRAKGGKL